jgi:hypothetical protein
MPTSTRRLETRPGRVKSDPVPAAVLPAQTTSGFGFGADSQPEKRLMLAVLDDAVAIFLRDAGRPPGATPAEFGAACSWLSSPDDEWPFSFVAICRALALDPSAIRRGLRQWQDGESASSLDERRRRRPSLRRMSGSRTRACSRPLGRR